MQITDYRLQITDWQIADWQIADCRLQIDRLQIEPLKAYSLKPTAFIAEANCRSRSFLGFDVQGSMFYVQGFRFII
ncbi:MAG TPA: hypothetical protein PK110_14385 [Niabella sp.]|nr:hypothetical protein [Niabella sp.]